MIKIYGKVGTFEQIIDASSNPECPEGCIEMIEERPTPDHIACKDGQWRLKESEESDDR